MLNESNNAEDNRRVLTSVQSQRNQQLRAPSRDALDLGCASLGVRGLLWDISGETADEYEADVESKLRSLGELGVRRAHLILSPGEATSPARTAAESKGFTTPPGEKLFVRTLEKEPESHKGMAAGYSLRDGRARDILRIGLELQNQPELAFENWEFPLVAEGISKANCFFKVIEFENEVVGISIGGAFNGKGTISHTWVHPDHRWRPGATEQPRLGQVLSSESLRALFISGARTVHLMTTADNKPAEDFWRKQGFAESSQGFLEINL
jgi:ribosomal protein S18 acetylase RimI-like enzyme